MKTTQTAAIAVIIILSGLLPSCMPPDPVFSKNAGMIQSINYPSSKIVGSWVSFSISPFQSETSIMETKTYYDIYTKGRGRTRQFTKNMVTGDSIEMEANFRWDYLGANTWNITLPSSSQYRVTGHRQMEKGNIGSREIRVRYYQGKLYAMTTGQVWEPANAKNVKDLTRRLREQEPLIKIDLNSGAAETP